MQRSIKYLFFVTLLLLAVAFWRSELLPPPQALLPSLLFEPEQTPIEQAPFTSTVGGVAYTIQPLYRYDLYGLVVSRHDSKTWWDYAHEEWHDHLNVADLCVVWGNNARTGSYQAIAFSSGQFVCYASTNSSAAWSAFDMTALSNNHLLTDQPALAKQINAARVGDQIHLQGYLAEYSHNHGFAFHRGTSTVRSDSGNGACETVYVENFSILRSGGGVWRKVFWLSVGLLVLELILWFMMPVGFDD